MYINLITIDLCPGQSGGGIHPAGTLTISKNGMYNVYPYASASVDVHPSESLSETYLSNGSYTITGEFNGGMVTVNVPSPQFVTESLSVSANGTYTPGEGVDGYSQVVVDVPVVGWDQKSLTEGTVEIINLNNSASFVASSAFQNNKTIQTVNLPYATTVGDYAFQSCYSLSQVDLPMCSSIGGYAFQSCSSLNQVSLPVCSSIGDYAFYSCSSLNQVSLPMCSYIGGNAFYNCSVLTQVNLPMCSYIGDKAFNNCSSLSQVNLPMCSYIGGNAFYKCSSLSQVSLPMCNTIADGIYAGGLGRTSGTFYGCSLLTQVSLPVCSYIGSNAFNGCSSLSIITIGYSSVCELNNSYVFGNTPIASGTGSIYVPASLVDAYKSAENWSKFSSRIFPISE